MKNLQRKLFLAILFFFCLVYLFPQKIFAVSTIEFSNKEEILNIGSYIEVLEDKNDNFSIDQVINSKKFSPTKMDVPNLGITHSAFWIRFKIKNLTSEYNLLLELAHPTTDQVEFYDIDLNGNYIPVKLGEYQSFFKRKYKDPNYIFDILLEKNQEKVYLMKIKSREQIQLPLRIGTYIVIFDGIKYKDIFTGIYLGILLIMSLYNLFLYFSVRDKSYLLYVFYIVLILLTQTSSQGYTYLLLWPNFPWLQLHCLFLFPSLVGMIFIEFTKDFLRMKEYTPKMWKGANYVHLSYSVCILTALLGQYIFSYKLIEITAAFISFYMLCAAIVISKKYRPARFYVTAWSIFLVGVIVFVLKDFEVLPYTNITRYTMQIGSAIESVLLSFALADRINILKKEKQEILERQTETLKIKVAEATHELKDKNEELEDAYKKLQEAQAELLQQEKMVSLGQMAAGVAHEINNPIHITNQAIDIIETSKELYEEYIEKLEKILSETKNIDQQLQELSSYKKEIEFDEIAEDITNAIKRAKNGIERTATITKELKSFSKIDSEGWVTTNINNDLEAMLNMLQSQIGLVKIKKSYEPIPNINCNSQKLNQLYQNIFSNALEAIKAKDIAESLGIIEIKTYILEDNIVISFADNGIGMSDIIKQKAFNPFYTTKGAQRKGLGLANVYSTLLQHEGKVELESEEGVGTLIKLILPIGITKSAVA